MEEKGIKDNVLDWVKILLIALLVALIISRGLIVNATVPTSSMEKTIMVGDRLIANRLAYNFAEPQRGDIIIFLSREHDNDLYVKRLIGLPGEEVNIVDGAVYIDDELLEEDYIGTPDGKSFGPYQVPEGHYFFLGDNRSFSGDARRWDQPYISREDLVGKVVFGYYPKLQVY